ncbi:MAG TPA: hypothetical protein IGS53_11520 [Leptolyngbyaceae cyanobacterium M33_DOE_097]|uniref:Uncharacterized protein n=1 Tax=Oscillatoriales cyanobacterium SpSt-418 TaxID=2282169 RepID=A0A7C3KGW2_9CYAN|nr:hypothetical protein [Leptolyngbyaceae cyanobacterium M33_DOE_097]
MTPPVGVFQCLPLRQLANLKLILSGGVILCSTVGVYRWQQAVVSQPTSGDTQISTKVPDATGSPLTTPQLVKDTNPEPIAELLWSDRPAALPKHMEAVYEDALTQSQTLASQNQLTEAIRIVAGIPSNSRHFAMAQQLQDDWSRELLRQATNECQQANVTKAVALLKAIPVSSPLYRRANQLQQNWNQQAQILNQAIMANKKGDWQAAIDAVKALETSPMFHSLRVQELLQQAMIKLYEPDAQLLQIATADLPAVEPSMDTLEPAPTSIAMPESNFE